MGNKQSREDEICLLDDDEVSTLEFHPVFQILKLVLIGCHRSGKIFIGNAIFGEKVFTSWKFFGRMHIVATRTVSGRRIHLSLIRGWRGELKSKRTKRAIVHCVQTLFDTGPHAVILLLKVNSRLSESTISTLEGLLGIQMWDHTIVVFTKAEKLGDYSIEDYIRSEQLQPLIDKCGGRYLEVRNNDTNQITERIEELIASKSSTSFFKISNQEEVDVKTLLTDWNKIVKRGKCKINFLSKCKNNLKYKLKEHANNEYRIKAEIKAKDAEIKRLKSIVQEKEREIARLRSSIEGRPDPSELQRRITELEHQVEENNKEIEKKDTEIEELRTELHMWRENAVERRTSEDQCAARHVEYRSEFRQDVSANFTRHDQIPLQELHVQGWRDTLLQILMELSDNELKRMIFTCQNHEFGIPQSSMENKGRVDLAEILLKQWRGRESVLKTRDLMKKIPRNDDSMIDLFTPFLKDLGEKW